MKKKYLPGEILYAPIPFTVINKKTKKKKQFYKDRPNLTVFRQLGQDVEVREIRSNKGEYGIELNKEDFNWYKNPYGNMDFPCYIRIDKPAYINIKDIRKTVGKLKRKKIEEVKKALFNFYEEI